MGMTAPGETHTVEVELEGERSAAETQEFMRALRELLSRYSRARVGPQRVCVRGKSRQPDPKKD
jgi:hypothetical protein